MFQLAIGYLFSTKAALTGNWGALHTEPQLGTCKMSQTSVVRNSKLTLWESNMAHWEIPYKWAFKLHNHL